MFAFATVEAMNNTPQQQFRIERLRDLLTTKFEDNKAALGRALGYSSGAFVRQMLEGERPITEKTVDRVHELPGCTNWFVPGTSERGPHYGGKQAHRVSHPITTVVPHLEWEELMNSDLPAKFELTLLDDAMAPRARVGQIVTFDRSLEARPGDGVLVTDSSGAYYFRLFRAGTAGRWQAHALNEAYQPLDSDRDALSVVAVLVGVQSRWS